MSIISGPPGPRPEQLLVRIAAPLLVLWGDRDTFTPIDGPVGRYFRRLPDVRERTQLQVLPGGNQKSDQSLRCPPVFKAACRRHLCPAVCVQLLEFGSRPGIAVHLHQAATHGRGWVQGLDTARTMTCLRLSTTQ